MSRQPGEAGERVKGLLEELGVVERCHSLLDSYKEEAVRSLSALENASLKGLLRRVVSRIFGVEIKGWCKEQEMKNRARDAAPLAVPIEQAAAAIAEVWRGLP